MSKNTYEHPPNIYAPTHPFKWYLPPAWFHKKCRYKQIKTNGYCRLKISTSLLQATRINKGIVSLDVKEHTESGLVKSSTEKYLHHN